MIACKLDPESMIFSERWWWGGGTGREEGTKLKDILDKENRMIKSATLFIKEICDENYYAWKWPSSEIKTTL